MLTYASFIARKSIAWAITLSVIVISLVSLAWGLKVKQDDDILAFLPRSNPEVQLFYEVNKRFGGLDVAIVGLNTPDVFDSNFISRLGTATRALNETEGIAYALSLTSVEDFTPDPEKGGISVSYLAGSVPKDAEEQKALREKVMARDQIVGNLISSDGKSTLLYCFAAHGADVKTMAARARAVIEKEFPNEAKYWGGAPFISTYIYGVTQSDLRRLAPWAVALIVLITIVSFRDVIGSALALLSTAAGILIALGLMGAAGVPSNIMLGSMPVILFALGSAYSIHILARYYANACMYDCEHALVRTLCEIGPAVIASGLTTVVGLLSYLMMDIQPMRTFGVFTAVGILASLILAVTFVPAVIRIANLKGKPAPKSITEGLFAKSAVWIRNKRVPVGAAIFTVAAAGAFFTLRVDSRMDNAAFFSKNSPPDQAERFLAEHFGGSLFVQLHIHGDMAEPATLREVRAISDRISLLPGVSSVNDVAAVISQVNEAMEGDRRIPDTAAKIALLYRFVGSNRAVTQLITDDRKEALVQIKLSVARPAEVDPVLEQIEAIGRAASSHGYVKAKVSGAQAAQARARLIEQIQLRMTAVSKLHGVPWPESTQKDVENRIAKMSAAPDAHALKASLKAFLGSDEFPGELPQSPEDALDRAAGALASLPASASENDAKAALAKALEKDEADEAIADLASSAYKPLVEIRRRELSKSRASALAREAAIPVPEGEKGARYMSALANAFIDLDNESVYLPVELTSNAEGMERIQAEATGLPVLHRGLSKSVASNQIKSLLFAFGLVICITVLMFRSLSSGLLAVAPIAVTLLIIYGGMGYFDIRLDIGTSILASLIVGAGIDYAIHVMACWNAGPGRPVTEAVAAAARHAGLGIWINAIMVAAGFFVLTLGEARPLQNVGGLTAAAMLVAAVATFALLPVLGGKNRYLRPVRIPNGVVSSEAESPVLTNGSSSS